MRKVHAVFFSMLAATGLGFTQDGSKSVVFLQNASPVESPEHLYARLNYEAAKSKHDEIMREYEKVKAVENCFDSTLKSVEGCHLDSDTYLRGLQEYCLEYLPKQQPAVSDTTDKKRKKRKTRDDTYDETQQALAVLGCNSALSSRALATIRAANVVDIAA